VADHVRPGAVQIAQPNATLPRFTLHKTSLPTSTDTAHAVTYRLTTKPTGSAHSHVECRAVQPFPRRYDVTGSV
jgi:hypothetical protein